MLKTGSDDTSQRPLVDFYKAHCAQREWRDTVFVKDKIFTAFKNTLINMKTINIDLQTDHIYVPKRKKNTCHKKADSVKHKILILKQIGFQ